MPPNFNNSFDNMLFPDRLRNLPPPSMDQRARFDRFRGNAGGGYSPPINFNPFIPAPREAPFSYGNQNRQFPPRMQQMPPSYRNPYAPSPFPQQGFGRYSPMMPQGGRGRRYGNQNMRPIFGGGMGQVVPTNMPFRDQGYGSPMRSQNLIQSLSGPNNLMNPYRGDTTLGMLDRFRGNAGGGYPPPPPRQAFLSPYGGGGGGYPPPGGGGGGGYPPTHCRARRHQHLNSSIPLTYNAKLRPSKRKMK